MNPIWIKIKTAVGQFFSFLYLLAIGRWWWRLYRLLREQRYSTVTLQSYKSFRDLVEILRTCTWTADGWEQLWDTISYPGKVQHVINTQPAGKRSIGDCGAFAVYIANVLEQSATFGGFENGRFVLEPWNGLMLDRARILTVTWIDKDGNYNGHNVCLIDWYDLNATRHPLNGADFYSYMDYDYPKGPDLDIRGVIERVMKDYAPGGKCLCWSIHDKDLNLEQIHF